jgi:hypothetical protein
LWIGDWGLGIGGLGFGDWALGLMPNPQSPLNIEKNKFYKYISNKNKNNIN